jgi:hypothetical protein
MSARRLLLTELFDCLDEAARTIVRADVFKFVPRLRYSL